MKMTLCMLVAIGLAGSTALGADLNVSVLTAAGESSVTVLPGAQVDYQVVGQLNDVGNLGLALFGFDLAFDGGDLAQADEPGELPMDNFARNLGITNPAGFGGTMIGGNLIQCGGGQNTINNVDTNAPFPVGTVITNLGHEEVVLLTGSLEAPAVEGTYTLALSNLFGNVITSEQAAYWAVEAFNAGTIGNLTIEVGDPCAVTPLLATTSMAPDASLTRTQGHVLRFTFDADIALTAREACPVYIRELLPGGAYGEDLSGSFSCTVEGGTTLRIAETGTVLDNETWYGIENKESWDCMGDFKVCYAVVRGDVNNSGFTNFSDLSTINQNLTGSSADDDVYDINASGFVNFADISTANGFINSEAPPKPDGHVCLAP